MTYVNLDNIQVPANNQVALPTWGQGVNANFDYLYAQQQAASSAITNLNSEVATLQTEVAALPSAKARCHVSSGIFVGNPQPLQTVTGLIATDFAIGGLGIATNDFLAINGLAAGAYYQVNAQLYLQSSDANDFLQMGVHWLRSDNANMLVNGTLARVLAANQVAMTVYADVIGPVAAGSSIIVYGNTGNDGWTAGYGYGSNYLSAFAI
jgi:hypothetical protein